MKTVPIPRKIRDKDFILKSGELVPIGRKHQTAAHRAYRECFEKLIMGEVQSIDIH
jgi:hypothetical protein